MNAVDEETLATPDAYRSVWIWPLALFLAVAVFAVTVLVPWSPDLIPPVSGDPPLMYTLHEIHRSGLSYGREFLSPYGPWAIWYWKFYHPNTFIEFLISHVAVAMVLMVALVTVATRYIKSPVIQLGFILSITAMFAVDLDARLYFLCLLAVALFADRRDIGPILYAAILAAVAFAGLVKASVLFIGMFLAVLFGAIEILRDRRVPWTPLIYSASLVSLWWLAGQDLGALPSFVAGSAHQSAAYADYQAEVGPIAEVLVFVAGAGIVMLYVLWRELHASGIMGLLPVIAYSSVLFVAFKAGFVRQDGQHVLHAYTTLATLALTYVAMHNPFGDGMPRPHSAAATHLRRAVPVAGVLAFAVLGAWVLQHPTIYADKLSRWGQNTIAGLEVISGRSNMEAAHEVRLAEIRAAFPLPATDGTVTMLTTRQTVAFAHGLSYRPLPFVVGWYAWSAELAQHEAAFLAARDGPVHVFADTQVYTGFHPWLALFENYRPSGSTDTLLRFSRGEPRPAKLTELMTVAGRLDTPVAVPERRTDGLLWARIDVQPTPLGRLARLLFRVPPVWLVLSPSANGEPVKRRVARSQAAAGLLVSPLIGSLPDLQALARCVEKDCSGAEPLGSLVVTAGENGGWFYKQQISVTFHDVDFEDKE